MQACSTCGAGAYKQFLDARCYNHAFVRIDLVHATVIFFPTIFIIFSEFLD
jgi:hypothetical protein